MIFNYRALIVFSVICFFSCTVNVFQEEAITTLKESENGYQYYKFVVEAIDLAGPYCAILTETSFMDGYVPITDNYKVLSRSHMEVGGPNNEELGDMRSLFDGYLNATDGNHTYYKYVKFTTTPWEWIVDMGSPSIYTSLTIASHETFFYSEPSRVKIYGSNDTTTWNVIGNQTFTKIYQTTSISLSY